MRKHVRVLQLIDETHEGGMWKSAEISMPILSKKIEVTLQPFEAYANEARLWAGLRVPEMDGRSDGDDVVRGQQNGETKVKF